MSPAASTVPRLDPGVISFASGPVQDAQPGQGDTALASLKSLQ